MHSLPHPKTGHTFRINLSDGNVHAYNDLVMHGSSFKLLDWADRIEVDQSISHREKEVALMFFAHRCQPDLPPMDPVPISMLNLDGAVYGICEIHFEGRSHEELVVLRELDLVTLDS